MKMVLKGLFGILMLFAGFAMLQGQNQLDDQGRKTGPWRVEYENGNILYEANFEEGRPVGTMVRYYDNGAVRARMLFHAAENRSFTSLYYQSGKLAGEGLHVNQLKDSVWTYFSEFDGTIRIKETYKNGKLHGWVRSFYPQGGISEEVSWQNNLKQGPWKQYYQDGSLRLKSQYENDKLNGTYELFFPDGTIKIKGGYLDSKSEGTWSFYNEKGLEAYSIEYQKGRAVDQEKYLQMMQDTLQKYDLISEPESIQQF